VATQATRTGRTGTDGRYTVLFAGGGGDYVVTITSIGWTPARLRVERIGDEAVLVANARMERLVVSLEAVKVEAEPLNGLGWIFMIASLIFVVGLTVWCYYRVLKAPAAVPEPAKDFHSA
jgi:hypothetical protein